MTRRRADAPRDRRWTDPEGTRRASREFGGKGAGRRPREKKRRKKLSGHEGMWARTRRQTRALGKFGKRHKGSLTILGLVAAAIVSLLVFRGAVGVTSAGILAGGAVGGAAVRSHRRRKTMNRSANAYAPSWRERRQWSEAQRRGQPTPWADQQGGDRVTVHAHRREGDPVKTHTRAKPGQGQGRSRRFDGQPETTADTKFFDLRESGYRGPIDQDGNRVDDMKGWMERNRRPAWRDRYDADQGGGRAS